VLVFREERPGHARRVDCSARACDRRGLRHRQAGGVSSGYPLWRL